ncbi:MAG TPA: bifunctional adenosylcobinamide kinase/adenosylcobinamide-phosphate guanylyltransferase [Bordetella sp.]
MDLPSAFARTELVLGGQKSGKSRHAEERARAWLPACGGHRAVLVATGQARDAEMAARIARHRRDRALRVPGMATVEEPLLLAQKIAELSRPEVLVIVDCMTLWLTNWLMPADGPGQDEPAPLPGFDAQAALLFGALAEARGPVILVSNEIGLGVIPMGRHVRAFVDALGTLNQRLAQACERVTLVSAGLPLALKGRP